jgi:hypothetical protein
MKALESLDEYTVGWVSALPLELAAATAMLDEEHGKPLDFEKPSTDRNTYTWGRIGDHNVVIASLPAGVYGTISDHGLHYALFVPKDPSWAHGRHRRRNCQTRAWP